MKKWHSALLALGISLAMGGAAQAETLTGMVNGSDVYAKVGANTGQWVQLTSGMAAHNLKMAGDRIAFLDASGGLWLKQGGIRAQWYLQTTGVSDYALAQNYLLAKKTDNTAWMKEGQDPTGQWDSQMVASNVSKVYLSSNQMAVLFANGDLRGKVLSQIPGVTDVGFVGVTGTWSDIAKNVTQAAITDTRLVYIDTNNDVRGKDGPIWYSWWNNGQVIDTRAGQVGLLGNKYCAVLEPSLIGEADNNKYLYCKTGAFSAQPEYT
ncbi:MAG TPA: hypothetical protein VHQ86_01310, partial [Candidatus Saccharimonadia bacterium]|nr:hypothetical protein [Candidatus Saccharimonadia bacterium]